jgi:SPP1 family predicted phage head-tail adaptor
MGRLNAGELREKVILYNRNAMIGSANITQRVGEATPAWATQGNAQGSGWVRAKVGPVKSLKAAVYRGQNLKADFECTIRYRPTVDASWRVGFEDQIYAIEHVVHDRVKWETVMLLSLTTETHSADTWEARR